MDPRARRGLLAALGAVGAAGAAHAATFGNPDTPPQGAVNASKQALGNPGPRNPILEGQFPSLGNPPPTDDLGMPMIWASFNNAHRRIQAGGWARQVTVDDFAISKSIAGVNMRLDAGGSREMHWHQQAEWGFVSNGTTRITVLDDLGHPQVADVGSGGLWYFPAGLPHSLQGLGPDGTEFILAFDEGSSSEDNTLLITDWLAHTPPEVLAKNFGVSADAFKNIPLTQRWIFPGPVPGPLQDDQKAAAGSVGQSAQSFVFDLGGMQPNSQTKGGSVRIADSSNFHISRTIAAALVTIEPGGMREMHWHPNADEWQYWVRGKGRMTVFNTGPHAMTADFNPGDIGYVKKSLGHYIENTGNDQLVFLEIFKTDRYKNVSLADWMVHTPPAMVEQTLNIDLSRFSRLAQTAPNVVPV